jgi:geranylgeranyl pyrophosphate synthase
MQGSETVDAGMREVRSLIDKAIRQTSLQTIADRFKPYIGSGKMLRARLILGVGPAAGVPSPVLHMAAASVEMLHAASLLHDDVLDGGTERRGHPAFWVSEGTKAAVLMGDLLVSRATGYVLDTLPDVMPVLVATLQEMCDAEVDQEFQPSSDRSWAHCVSIARRKTGSLFGLAACCAGSGDPARSAALRRAGYALGTAYQLADDLLDTSANVALAGKTLGTDAQANKLTAATARRDAEEDPVQAIESFLKQADHELVAWPAVRRAWAYYTDRVITPVVNSFSACATADVAI